MDDFPTARDIARLQLKYYNARDLDRFCALFHESCILVNHISGEIIANSPDSIREMYYDRFSNENLHCVVHEEMDIGNVAIDKETVSGLPSGDMEIIAIYQVNEGKINKVSFIRP